MNSWDAEPSSLAGIPVSPVTARDIHANYALMDRDRTIAALTAERNKARDDLALSDAQNADLRGQNVRLRREVDDRESLLKTFRAGQTIT